MATRVRSDTGQLYEQDFYVWVVVQAELLRERRFEALDLENLIEEVEGLGDAKRTMVLNNASVVVEHLLKLQFSPTADAKVGWIETVLDHRARPELGLTPRLRQILGEELPRVYAITRRSTERKLRLRGEDAAADALLESCPYTPDQITGDRWPSGALHVA